MIEKIFLEKVQTILYNILNICSIININGVKTTAYIGTYAYEYYIFYYGVVLF